MLVLLILPSGAWDRKELTALVRAKDFDGAFAWIAKEVAKLPKDDSIELATLLSYQGELCAMKQQHKEAIALLRQCLRMKENVKADARMILESNLRLARLFVIDLQIKEAQESYQTVIKLAKEMADQNVEFGIKAELAELLLKKSNVAKAWLLMRDELPLALSADVKVHWLSVQSKVYFASGSFAAAYQSLRDAEVLCQQMKQNSHESALVISMEACALAQRLQLTEAAESHLEQARKHALMLGVETISASTRWSLAVLEAELSGDTPAAIYQAMVITFEQCKNDDEFVAQGSIDSAQIKLASLALDAKNDQAVLHWCHQLEESLLEKHSLRALLYRYRAAAYHRLGNVSEAQKQAALSARTAQQWLGSSRLFGVAENLIGLENSVDLLSPLMLYARPEERAKLLLDCLLTSHDAALEEWIQLRQNVLPSKDRDAMEKALREMRLAHDQKWQSIDQFQNLRSNYLRERTPVALPEQGALVHYFLYRGEDEQDHYAAIVCQKNVPPVCKEIGVAEVIHSRVRAMLLASESQATDAAYRGTSPVILAEKLYELLWAPLELSGEDVCIRPAGMLQFVPWSILRKPKSLPDHGYLCQQHHNLRVIACSRKETRAQASDLRLSLLGVIEQQKKLRDQAFMIAEEEDFSDLPGVAREFDSIRSTGIIPVFQQTRANALDFSHATVMSSSMLHVSCHGFVQSSDHPLLDGASVMRQAGMIFHQYGASNDGLMYVEDVPYLALDHINSMMLSLCRGGLSNHAGLENWSSLRRAFLAAGVAHVAAAQWKIVDDDMQYFMRHLYEKIQRGEALSMGMQQTQCDWIEGKIPHSAKFSPAMRIATGGAWVVESAGW